MRFFVALELPWKEEMRSWQEQLPDGRMTFTKDCHLTLKFLDDVDTQRVDVIVEQLGKITFAPFTLTLRDIGVFPTWDHIRVIWVGVEDFGACIDLSLAVNEALSDMFEKDDRFVPHLTLARVKSIDDKEVFVEKLHKTQIPSLHTEITSFSLLKSELGTDGPVYTTIARFPLK